MKHNIESYLISEEDYLIFEGIDNRLIEPLRFFQLLEQAEEICLHSDFPFNVEERYFSFLSKELPKITEGKGSDFEIGRLIAQHLSDRLAKTKTEDWRFNKIKRIPFSVIQSIINKNVIIDIPLSGSPPINKIKTKRDPSSNQNTISEIIKIVAESCKDIVVQPELYKILKKHFVNQSDKQLENHRTGHIITKSNDKSKEFKIENQHLTGQSETKNSTGTVDFAVFSNNERITIGEAVNFSGQNTKSVDLNIIKHLKKLTQNYNYSTHSDLIFLIYYDGTPDKFHLSFDNYLKHFVQSSQFVAYPARTIKDITKDFAINSASIKLAKSIHSYSGDTENEFSIYHSYINFSEK